MHVSHEFKTPLTAIQGATELIQEHGTTMPPEQFARFLYNITTDAERLNKLVTRLLEMARADVTLPRQEKSEFNFIMKELQSRYQDSNFKIINSQTEATLPIPEDIIITILGNLIENSRQHGATEVVISVEKDVSKIKVIIADNGHGISKANIDKLFTPFFTTKRDQGGTGLGLIIVRALLTAYKADIKSMSKKAGAHFIIIFP